MLQTPVAFLIFNRPGTTERVFAEIAKARPLKLLVVADGPRADRPGEAEKCAAARAIINRVDWDCKVLTNYSDVNLGCKYRVSSGLDWVFENCEEAIILEDDCLPHPTFFPFCEELLERYRDDERVMMISGTNIFKEWRSGAQSYHFSHYGSIWGWASWKRAWRYYDRDMKMWEQAAVRDRIRSTLASKRQFQHRFEVCSKTYEGQIDTWDYQWTFARLLQSGLSVVSSVNLISNIGYGDDASHTTNVNDDIADIPTQSISFPLKAPGKFEVDRTYDERFIMRLSGDIGTNLFKRGVRKISRLLQSPTRLKYSLTRKKNIPDNIP